MASRIKAARQDRGWSQTRLIAEMQRLAQRRGDQLPSLETLKSRVSRWENGHATPDDFYRQLLREAFGMDDAELGFAAPRQDALITAVDELQLRLSRTKAVDGALLKALQCQTEAIRVQDRQYGAGLLLEQLRGHVLNLDAHLRHSVFDQARRPLATMLADASALAGWQALDVGAIDQAWRSFELSTAAASIAGNRELVAFARLEQAHVLSELRFCGTAADLAEDVWSHTSRSLSGAMRCWVAAAVAELVAGDRRKDRALTLLAEAERAEGELDHEKPTYLVFDRTHLRRWIGHTLVIVHDKAAERALREAMDRMDPTFARASASLSLDLAAALMAKDERQEAGRLLSQGEQLARAVGSRRQLARAQKLRVAS